CALVQLIVERHDLVHLAVQKTPEKRGSLLPNLSKEEMLNDLRVQRRTVFFIENGVFVKPQIKAVLDKRTKLNREYGPSMIGNAALSVLVQTHNPAPPSV